MGGDGLKKIRLEQSVLMMPFFGPWIGEKDPDFLESNARRQRMDEFQCFRPDKMAVR